MLKFPFEPCIPIKTAKVPDRPEWFHEVKHDGYRPIVQRDGKRVRLFKRTVLTGLSIIHASSRPHCAIGIPHS